VSATISQSDGLWSFPAEQSSARKQKIVNVFFQNRAIELQAAVTFFKGTAPGGPVAAQILYCRAQILDRHHALCSNAFSGDEYVVLSHVLQPRGNSSSTIFTRWPFETHTRRVQGSLIQFRRRRPQQRRTTSLRRRRVKRASRAHPVTKEEDWLYCWRSHCFDSRSFVPRARVGDMVGRHEYCV